MDSASASVGVGGEVREVIESREVAHALCRRDDADGYGPRMDADSRFRRSPDSVDESRRAASRERCDLVGRHYSHSIVPGGFDVTSYATRFTPGTSLTIREAMRSRTPYGRRAQSAVIASSLVTARITIGCS